MPSDLAVILTEAMQCILLLLLNRFSRVRLLATPWTAAHQAPPSMGFFQARVLEWGAIAFSSSVFYAYFNYACPPGWSGDESVQLRSDG